MWVEIVKLHQTPPTFCIITLKRTIFKVGMIVSLCEYVICSNQRQMLQREEFLQMMLNYLVSLLPFLKHLVFRFKEMVLLFDCS